MQKEDFGIFQIFPTIQGEGRFIGEPLLLIRFDSCNLSCPFCDTKYALKKTTEEATRINDSFQIFDKQIKEKLFEIIQYNIDKHPKKNKRLHTIMITGGEPLLYPNIINLINESYWVKKILIETNGTLISKTVPFLAYNIDNFEEKVHLTISPKLDLACYNNIYNLELIIDIFRSSNKILRKHKNIIDFKFIYSDQNKDSILEFTQKLQISPNRCFAMPLTPNMNIKNSLQQFKENCKRTIDFCLEHNFRFSPREHIWLFDSNNKEEKLNI